MQFLIFGTLKHSGSTAVVLALGYTFVRSVLITLENGESAKNIRKSKAVKGDKLLPVSIYTDIEYGTLLQLFPVFVSQAMLFWMILKAVWDQDRIEHLSDTQVWMYVCGTIVAAVIRMQLQNFNMTEYKPFWGPYFNHGFMKKSHLARTRFVLSWIVNSLLQSTSIFLLPAILMNASDNTEFVKDAISILFIAELDTMQKLGDEHGIPLSCGQGGSSA